MTTTRSRRVRQAIALATSAVLFPALLVGCAGSDEAGSDEAGRDSAAEGVTVGGASTSMVDGDEAPDDAAANAPEAYEADDTAERSSRIEVDPSDLTQDKVVSIGTVSMTSREPDEAVREVQRIADEHAARIANERTETSPQGETEWARIVLRVPVQEFGDTMDKLKRVGQLTSSTQKSSVVTKQYVDLQSRVRAQEQSLARVELLYRRAESIRDIMTIESEVAQRQSTLDSLKGQLRVLKDQTSLSTITVHIREKRGAEPVERERAGFVAGLSSGWQSLTGLLVGLSMVTGALLPFLVLLLPLGVLTWWLGRRVLARRVR